MMVSDTQKPFGRYMKHHYKKIILIFLIFILVFITYDTIAFDKPNDDSQMVTGNIVFNGDQPNQPVPIAMMLDTGEIITKVDTDEYLFFTFHLDHDIHGKISFIVWIDDESFVAEDNDGNIKYVEITDNIDEYIVLYIDNSVKTVPNDETDNDESDEKNNDDKSDDDPSQKNETPNNDEEDNSDQSNNSDSQDNTSDSDPDEDQNETEDSSTNSTTDPESSDNSTTDDTTNTTIDPSQNTSEDPLLDPQFSHNITLSKTIWIEENQTWENQRYLEKDQEVLYNITIHNNDTGNLSNITLIDRLPNGVIYTDTNSTDNDSMYNRFYDNLNHTLNWFIQNMSVNQKISIYYKCITVQSGTQQNTVLLNATGNGNAFYEKNTSAELFVFGDLIVDKSVWDSNMMIWSNHLITPINSFLRMNITISYNGGFMLKNISCVDTFSDDMIFLGNATVNGVSTTVDYNESSHQFIWNITQLSNNDPMYLEFDMRIFNQSNHINTVTVTGYESIGKQLTGSAEVIIESIDKDKVYLNKKVGYSSADLDESLNATINDTILFSVEIKNIGNATIFNMTLRDYLPLSMEYKENSAVFYFNNQSFKKDPTINESSNLLTWSRIQTIIEDHIGPYEQCQLTFEVKLLSLGSFVNMVNFSYGRYDGMTTIDLSTVDNASVLVTDQIQPLQVTITSPDEIFVNTPVMFQAIVSGGQSPYMYFWEFDDGTNSTDASPVHEYINTGWYTISVKIRDQNNTTSTASKLINVIIKDTLPPLINLSVPARSIYVKGKEIIPFFTTIIFGTIEIEGMVIDNESDVELIQLFIDNSEVASFDQSPFFFTWDQKVFGRHEIKIVSIDTQGNMNYTNTIVWKFF